MKALGVLGTASNVGKTWITTALCAWLRREGVRVAPFKAQNMSNNAFVTRTGGEMARAQAVQAEACGLEPCVEMNPLLLKPCSDTGSQLIVLGEAQPHFSAREYYANFARHRQIVADVLDGWRSRCGVLVMEGAGSPVELNLLDRDLVNLFPIRHVDGKFVLVGDIDRGGIYAQLAGTWALLDPADRARSLGAIVNRFRGDLSLFPDPQTWLAPHAPGLDVLGTVPFRHDLQPEEEDGLSPADEDRGEGDVVVWIRYPHAACLTDCQPWWDDAGVRTLWTADAAEIARAKIIVLPGTKNTIADLRWLRARGVDRAILAAAQRGVLIVGICGGYQILGESLSDPTGVAGDVGEERGLGLLPVATTFYPQKVVCQTTAECDGERWSAYEVHMGRTVAVSAVAGIGDGSAASAAQALHTVWSASGEARPEGHVAGNVMATYLHGWFESPRLRARLARLAGFAAHRPAATSWRERRQAVYAAMADHVEQTLDLEKIRRGLGL
jgi:adenosylcobyric acid synthase